MIPAHAIGATVTLSVSTSTNIVFGDLDDGATGGGFRVRPDGSSGPLVGSTVTALGSIMPHPGQINLIGSTGAPIDLSIATATVNLTGPGAPMSVNDFNLVTNAGSRTQTVTLTATTNTFPVGATLNVNAGQVAGVYTGTYTINASYQ